MVCLLHIATAENTLFSHERGEHLGFAYLTAALRSEGVSIKVYEINGLEDLELIITDKPDIIGVSPFIHEFTYVAEVCETLKNILPSAIIVWGGVPVSSCVKQILREFSIVDIVIHGEGEKVLTELSMCVENKIEYRNISGIAYRAGDKVVVNPNRYVCMRLDDLPKPEHDMLNNPKISFARIATSRGCYGNCTFCSAPTYFNEEAGCKWRGHSMNYVVDEMWDIYKKYRIREFFFSDASIEDPPGEAGKERLEELANKILERKWNIRYRVFIRGDSFRKDHTQLIHKLSCSGLEKVFVGVESSSNELLKIYKKRSSVDQCIETIRLFREEGVLVEIGYIFFTPFCCLNDLMVQADFLYKMEFAGQFSYFFTQLEVYPNAPIRKELRKKGLLIKDADYKNLYCYTFQDPRVEQVMLIVDKLKTKEMTLMLREQSNTEVVLRRIKMYFGRGKMMGIVDIWESLQRRMNEKYYEYFLQIINHVAQGKEAVFSRTLISIILMIVS